MDRRDCAVLCACCLACLLAACFAVLLMYSLVCSVRLASLCLPQSLVHPVLLIAASPSLPGPSVACGVPTSYVLSLAQIHNTHTHTHMGTHNSAACPHQPLGRTNPNRHIPVRRGIGSKRAQTGHGKSQLRKLNLPGGLLDWIGFRMRCSPPFDSLLCSFLLFAFFFSLAPNFGGSPFLTWFWRGLDKIQAVGAGCPAGWDCACKWWI